MVGRDHTNQMVFFEPQRNTHPHVLSLPLRKNTCLVEWCSPLAPASLPLVSLVGSESQALQEKLRRLEAQPRGRPKWPSWDPEILEFDTTYQNIMKYLNLKKFGTQTALKRIVDELHFRIARFFWTLDLQQSGAVSWLGECSWYSGA